MRIENLSLVPDGYKYKDPRQLFYHYPSMPPVKLAKLMNRFFYYKALESVEQAASAFGCILVPLACVTWKRAKTFGIDRKVKVVGKTFFMMKIEEMTKKEKEKWKEFYEENVMGEEHEFLQATSSTG